MKWHAKSLAILGSEPTCQWHYALNVSGGECKEGKNEKKGPRERGPVRQLSFFNSNGVGLANFDAGFASKTLFLVDRNGFFVLKLIYFNGADINTFAATNALLRIDSYVIRHTNLQKKLIG
jgi:hypothetical protein